jgi:hypothetical protein
MLILPVIVFSLFVLHPLVQYTPNRRLQGTYLTLPGNLRLSRSLLKLTLLELTAADFLVIFDALSPLAEQGYSFAWFNIGIIYTNGQGTLQDCAKATQHPAAGE